jgi:predicted nucleic acid-binding Zn ribbon protein
VRPISHALPGALAELLRGAPLSDGKVTFAWNAAVGPALERMTTVRLERDTLVVQTASAQWAREIRRSHGVILARLQTLLGKDTVTSLSVRTKN